MADLIDRQAAIIKIFYAEKTKHIKCKDLATVLEILNEMPAAKLPSVDAVPGKRGKWIHRPEIGWGSTWTCSMCGEKTVESVMGEPRYRFCPMCGADMRGNKDAAD